MVSSIHPITVRGFGHAMLNVLNTKAVHTNANTHNLQMRKRRMEDIYYLFDLPFWLAALTPSSALSLSRVSTNTFTCMPLFGEVCPKFVPKY